MKITAKNRPGYTGVILPAPYKQVLETGQSVEVSQEYYGSLPLEVTAWLDVEPVEAEKPAKTTRKG